MRDLEGKNLSLVQALSEADHMFVLGLPGSSLTFIPESSPRKLPSLLILHTPQQSHPQPKFQALLRCQCLPHLHLHLFWWSNSGINLTTRHSYSGIPPMPQAKHVKDGIHLPCLTSQIFCSSHIAPHMSKQHHHLTSRNLGITLPFNSLTTTSTQSLSPVTSTTHSSQVQALLSIFSTTPQSEAPSPPAWSSHSALTPLRSMSMLHLKHFIHFPQPWYPIFLTHFTRCSIIWPPGQALFNIFAPTAKPYVPYVAASMNFFIFP